MPLSAINFVPKGPVKSADINQFFNLFTGVMVDQPVTFKNVLTVGGNQGTTTVPVKLYGAVGQTTHLLDLYTDNTNANPGWGIAASGQMGWGPGGAAPVDTNLSRVARQNGHASDTAGILISPYLEVAGNISATSYVFSNGATLTGPSSIPLQLNVNQDLLVTRNLILSTDATAPPLLHAVSVGSQWATLESPNGNMFVSAKLGAYLTGNAFYNATTSQWNRYDTSQGSVLVTAGQGSVAFQVTPSGANPIAGFTNTFNIANDGTVTTQGRIDAYSLRAMSNLIPGSGAGMELVYSSGAGAIVPYNRSTGHYVDQYIYGVNIWLSPQEGGIVTAGSLLRSNGMQINGSSLPANSVGMELFWSGGASVIQSFSRDAGTWQDLNLNAKNIFITPTGGGSLIMPLGTIIGYAGSQGQGGFGGAGGSTTSASLVPAGISLNIGCTGGNVIMAFNGAMSCSVAGALVTVAVYMDGTGQPVVRRLHCPAAGYLMNVDLFGVFLPSAAAHSFAVYWSTSAGTLSLDTGSSQCLYALEIKR